METPEAVVARKLGEFATKFIAHRQADVVKRDMTNSSALLNSFHSDLKNDPVTGVAFVNFYFKNYGRLVDMRRRYSKVGGTEMIEELTNWAMKEGVGKFKKGAYSQKFENMPPERIANEVAWGIVRKLKHTGASKKKGWYNKGKSKDIQDFYDELLPEYAKAVSAQLANMAV